MAGNSYGLLHNESVSAVTAYPSISIGNRRQEGNTEYIYAYNGSTAQAIKGAPVILTNTSGYTFVTTYAVGSDAGCTVLGLVNNATCAAGSYCWVAVNGIANAYVATAVVACDMIAVADGGGQCDVVSGGSAITQVIAVGTLIGRALEATAASAVVKVYIRGQLGALS
jgi:hypothetical protein